VTVERVHAISERDGRVLRLVLARPKANVLDAAMVAALRAALPATPDPHLKLVVIDHEGPNFSFGASVAEHLPDGVRGMLSGFHDLLRALEGVGVPTAAVVRGQCLGGGFELALACGRIFVDGTARVGLPEVKLGVFPPAGSVLLPLRVAGPVATNLLVTGATVTGDQAVVLGLADEVSDDPAASCFSWYDELLAPLSAVGLRHAWRAGRRSVARALAFDLPAIERDYLESLMAHTDPVEGLNAFLARRDPNWEDR
jgi:cyclohexa-1,5-dienecarbonyl-CoA hydratase